MNRVLQGCYNRRLEMARISMSSFSRALVIESPHVELDDFLAEVGIQSIRQDSVSDEASLIKALQETRAEVLFKRSRVPVSRAVVEQCPELHLVQLCCIGDDSVDKEACAEYGVLVCNDPVSNGRSVVEMVIGHLITLSRRLFETDVEMHEHHWRKNAVGRFEVLGKRLGIVGLGNIGRQVARAASSLGMEISFFDSRLVAQEVGEEMGWTRYETLEELFRSSDLVSVHTSALDVRGADNEGFLDKALSQLAADRPSTSPRIFLNLARGNLHGSEALLEAVRNGAIRRCAVDVFPSEPAPGAVAWSNPYADEPRIVCSPHIGAATQEAQPRIARRVATTVGRLSDFGALRDCVFSPKARIQLGEGNPGNAILAVVHSVARGTKKAIDDAIYEAEVSNLGSTHLDFDNGVAYDLSLIERPLSEDELEQLVDRAAVLADDATAIRAIHQITLR
jgi:D-3-phosphoglycerate dehydrogenase